MWIIDGLKKMFTEKIPDCSTTGSNQSNPDSMGVSPCSNLPTVRQEDPEEISQLRELLTQQEAQLQQTKAKLSRVTQENEYLSRRCSDMKATATHLRDTAFEESIAKERAVFRGNALKERLSITCYELAKVRQELQSSRNFGSAETSDDGKTLIDALTHLNNLVDELCFAIAELLPPTLLDTPFHGFQSTERHLESLHAFFENAKYRGASTPDVVQYTLQHVILVNLIEEVFSPFAPGLDMATSNTLHRLHAGISQQHSQIYSARWRSITYSEICSHIDIPLAAHDLVEPLLRLVPLLCPHGAVPPMAVTEDLLHKARGVTSAALTWHNKAKSSYTSWDYDVFTISPGCPFDTKEMRFGLQPARKSGKTGGTPGGDVVATLRLGLRASRSVQQEGGTYAKEVVTPVPAAVLTQNWTSVNE